MAVELIAAFVLDLVMGDPPRLPHPVRGMGWIISTAEISLRRWARTPGTERIAGVVLLVGVTAIAYGITSILIGFAGEIHTLLGSAATVYLAYTTLCVRSLRDAACKVFNALVAGDLPSARERLVSLVGRKTNSLDESGVVRATVESVAENASDGVVAPLFYMAIGGVPLAMAYKAVNTLDSMVGYRTFRYQHMGWASARMDDLANFIPARLTGVLISAIGVLYKAGRRSLRVMARDRRKHESPNSGVPEAAMAGVMGIQLGGPIDHPDKPGARPFIGEAVHEPEPSHILQAVSILYGVSILTIGLVLTFWMWTP